MTLFGKPASSYIRFAGPVTLLTLLIGMTRLALSLNGVPDDQTKWISMSWFLFFGQIYLAVRTETSGFGSYKHLLPSILVPNTVAHLVSVTGIVIAIVTGQSNAFTNPAMGEEAASWLHVGAHLTLGIIVGGLVSWLIGCLTLLITRALTRRRARAARA